LIDGIGLVTKRVVELKCFIIAVDEDLPMPNLGAITWNKEYPEIRVRKEIMNAIKAWEILVA